MKNPNYLPNYDSTLGHTWFQSAIDLAVMAEKKVAGLFVRRDKVEACRLYSCAIADATTAIKEIRENGDWKKEFSNTILDMEREIYLWKIQVYLLSK